jgi:hypothetical protein
MWTVKEVINGVERNTAFFTAAEAISAASRCAEPWKVVITSPSGIQGTINSVRDCAAAKKA